MPVAVVTDPYVRFDLKTVEEGYIIVKRMTYGQKMTRQQMAMKMKMQVGNRKEDSEIDIDMMNRLTSLWSFSNLIHEHNLTDEKERPLNFKNYADVEKLAGPIGEEIDTLIDKVNNFNEKDEDVENLSSGSEQQ